jgi:hypothetical protein
VCKIRNVLEWLQIVGQLELISASFLFFCKVVPEEMGLKKKDYLENTDNTIDLLVKVFI